jgi:phosphoglycolate phosphatase
MIKLIIFDLDGTLLNTLDDLADCTNYVLQKNGHATHDPDTYKYFVGNGTEILLSRALPQNISKTAFFYIHDQFLKYYKHHNAVKTAPYEGMIETLEKLQEKGILLAVATNKPHHMLRKLMKQYFPTIKWAAILGHRENVNKKPDPQIVYDILESIQHRSSPLTNQKIINKKEILYIGDTAVDMETAQNADIKKIGALWGFRSKEELVQAKADELIECPQELLDIIF